jgi:hypothetical protein
LVNKLHHGFPGGLEKEKRAGGVEGAMLVIFEANERSGRSYKEQKKHGSRLWETGYAKRHWRQPGVGEGKVYGKGKKTYSYFEAD